MISGYIGRIDTNDRGRLNRDWWIYWQDRHDRGRLNQDWRRRGEVKAELVTYDLDDYGGRWGGLAAIFRDIGRV